MASTSRLALTLLLLGGSAAASLAACGGDDDNGTSSQNDAGTTTPDGAVNGGPSHASAASVTIYYGATAKLDATGSTGPTGFTYEWALASGPDGTASTLTDANTATPSLTPDRVGVYNLTLKVAGGGTTSTIAVTVTVVDPPVFYAHAENDGGSLAYATFNVVGAVFGNAGTPISCFARDGGTSYSSDLSDLAGGDMDTWQGLPDQPSKLVYVFETKEDGGSNTSLLLSASNSSCAVPPLRLDEIGGGAPEKTRAFEQPKFSPSGNRIAYIRSVSTGATISTVGADGSARRDLAPYFAYADGGAAPTAKIGTKVDDDNLNTYRADWIDENTVAWLQASSGGWRVAAVADSAGASPRIVLDCPGTSDGGFTQMPDQFAMLANGDVLVSQRTSDGVQSLIAYSPDGAKNCSNRRDLSKLSSHGYAGEFSLSPDKSMIAFNTTPDAGVATEIRVITLDGTVVSETAGANALAPRWVGGGAFIAWPAPQSALSDAGSGTVIAVAQIDGGGLHQVTPTPHSGESYYGIGNGWCAMGRAYGSSTVFFGMLGVLGLRLTRRRKKN